MVFAISLSLPLLAQEAAAPKRADHYIDHIVLGIDDLDRGIEEVHRLTGVRPKFDGRDARLGTRSAVIGLGGNAFLEIVAPDPKANPDAIDPRFRGLFLDPLATFDTLTPFQWAIGTSNMELTLVLAGRVGNRPTDVFAGSRKRRWGRAMEWNWARVWRPLSHVAPIFVQWDEDTRPPQERAPAGCELTVLNINSRNYKSLQALLAALQVDSELAGAEQESLAFTLECDGKEIVFEAVPLTGSPWDLYPDRH